MRSPQSLRNGGDSPSPHPPIPSPHFHSTLSLHKLKRFNFLLLLFRLFAFSFSLASSIFMLTNSRWYHFDAFRYVFAANAIVTIYSIFEMGASVWEISKNATLFPEVVQVWFDFGHDQVFAYLLLSADSAGTALLRTLRNGDTCKGNNAFCIQSDVAVALGFVGFMFLGFSSLLSGFRVVCFIINGSRFHL